MQNEGFNSLIGGRIERLRNKFGYTREELAEKIGISWQHLANMEKGRRGVTTDLLFRLHDIFGVSIDYLFGFEVEGNDLSDINAWLINIDPSIYPYIEELVIAFIKAVQKGRNAT